MLDLSASTVVAIQPHRQGTKVATWTWDEGKVTVASVDGVTDEFVLRNTRSRDAPIAGAATGQRRYTSADQKGPAWAPWNDNYGIAPSGDQRRAAPRPAQKPKTLFDLLFKF